MSGPDGRFLDDCVREQGLESRSAALQRAVRLLGATELTVLYEAAWDAWTATGEEDAWAQTTRDGLRT